MREREGGKRERESDRAKNRDRYLLQLRSKVPFLPSATTAHP